MKRTLLAPAVGLLALGAAVGAGAVALVRPQSLPHATTQGTESNVPAVRFADATASAGIAFRHFSGAEGRKLLPETMGAGVCVLDYDRDGWDDLLFVNGCRWPGSTAAGDPPGTVLYRNRGNGTFEDATSAVGLTGSLYGMGVCAGDIDNDGFPDVYVSAVGGGRLLRNEAGRRFRDITSEAGLPERTWPSADSLDQFYAHTEPIPFESSATFVDYDGDGLLDLFVCRYVTWSPAGDLGVRAVLPGVGRAYVPPTQFEGCHNALYRNLGGGRFTDVSSEVGIEVRDGQRAVGKALGVIACDPDDDGWPDLIVANDTVRNFFFHNVPDPNGGRRFQEVGLAANVAYAGTQARGGMGIDWGEYEPGKNGLLIVNFTDEPNTFLTPLSADRVLFTDSATAVGLHEPSRVPLKFGAFFFDCDLDGRLDILTCNGHLEPDIGKLGGKQHYAQPAQLFWNTGGNGRPQFAPVTASNAGPDLFRPMVGRGCAYLDFDGDGDQDVVLTENNGPARLLRNDTALGHNWVRLRLEGDGTASNRSAIGAVVTVEAGGRTYRREVAGSRGYLSQSELTIGAGLGPTEKVDRVLVRWPGRTAGLPQSWTDLSANRVHELRQGVSDAVPRTPGAPTP